MGFFGKLKKFESFIENFKKFNMSLTSLKIIVTL